MSSSVDLDFDDFGFASWPLGGCGRLRGTERDDGRPLDDTSRVARREAGGASGDDGARGFSATAAFAGGSAAISRASG